jgi:eukaryotic-like serine/threonine-protein kinase
MSTTLFGVDAMTRRLSLDLAQISSPSLPKLGDVVAGKYQIDRTLGRGGMGAVFAVTHNVTGRRFAIKWLLAADAEGNDAVKRFIREARIASRIQHPHVVDVYDIYHEAPGIFMVMELLEGQSLASRRASEGCLAADEACNIMRLCAAGVAAAHAAGVVHRDLKPANIFLCKLRGTDKPHPKVLDFGISRLLTTPDLMDTTETRTGTVIGTPYYMAPEQLRGEASDHGVDVYALGVTLYELLSGKRPFSAVSYPDLVVKIVSGGATALKTLVPELPPGLAAVVARAMHHDPKARFPDVEAFARALEPFVAGPQPATPVLAQRGARTLRMLIALAGLIALAFGVGLYARARVASERAAAAPPPIVVRASAETAARELAAQPALAPAAIPAPVATPVSESADKAAAAQVPVPVREAAREPGHRKPASRSAAHSADARTRPGKAASHETWPENSRPKPRLNLDSM